MLIDRKTLLFFDSSCLIAAAGSPTGGSGFLLLLCANDYLKAVVSQPVLLEAQRNIQSKLGSREMIRFYKLLAMLPFSLAPLPGEDELAKLEKFINKKDIHIAGAALEVRAPFLLTLDRGLVLEMSKTSLSVQALTPGDFIKKILPQHIDYPTTRE